MSARERIEAIRIIDPQDATLGEILTSEQIDEIMKIVEEERHDAEEHLLDAFEKLTSGTVKQYYEGAHTMKTKLKERRKRKGEDEEQQEADGR